MSRCFPFPPPGYEKKLRPEEGDLLKEVCSILSSLCGCVSVVLIIPTEYPIYYLETIGCGL